MDSQYKVIFHGELSPGKNIDDVKQSLAALYKIPVTKLTPWFSNSPMVIKEKIDYKTASKYKQAFEQAGAICHIEEMQNSLPSLQTAKPLNDEKSLKQEQMTCPKCGEVQPNAAICRRCKIIIEKYKSSQKSQNSTEPKEESNVKQLKQEDTSETLQPQNVAAFLRQIQKYQQYIIILLILILIGMFFNILFQPKGRGKVLIITLEDDKKASSGLKLFQQALKKGGQVKITVDEIQIAYPEFSEFTLLNTEGQFLVNGAVINFIISQGWEFESINIGGVLVFTQK